MRCCCWWDDDGVVLVVARILFRVCRPSVQLNTTPTHPPTKHQKNKTGDGQPAAPVGAAAEGPFAHAL